MGKKNVHKLSETNPLIALLGISSHENDYRISWALNEHLGFHLHKIENHHFFHPKLNETLEFSQYQCEEPETAMVYRLISNRCDNGFLLEEYKNIDFLLLLDSTEPAVIQETIKKIKTIPFISMVFQIDLQTLKNKQRVS